MLRPMTSQSAENKRHPPPISTRPREDGRRGEDCQSWRLGSRALTWQGIAIIGSHSSDGVHKTFTRAAGQSPSGGEGCALQGPPLADV